MKQKQPKQYSQAVGDDDKDDVHVVDDDSSSSSSSSSSDEDDNDNNNNDDASSVDPVESDYESNGKDKLQDDDDQDDDAGDLSLKQQSSTLRSGSDSRLFSSYRTLGIWTSGRPYHLVEHQNSTNAMLVLPIGNRFHMVQCDRLHPVLVSQQVPSAADADDQPTVDRRHGTAKKKKQKKQRTDDDDSNWSSNSNNNITHVISEAGLRITVAAHQSRQQKAQVTLFSRTHAVDTLSTSSLSGSNDSHRWSMVDMLHLGTIPVEGKGEKRGKTENAVLVGAILVRHQPHLPEADERLQDEEDQKRGITVLGRMDDDDDDDEEGDDNFDPKKKVVEDDDESSSSSSSSSSASSADTALGQVVLLIATRNSLRVHKRIPLPDTIGVPTVALHPSTYINKIVVGGENGLTLLNIRTSKVLYTFEKSLHQQHITALQQSPAVDTIAVGTKLGMVHLINLKLDRCLFSLRHASSSSSTATTEVSIMSISFRNDASALRYGIAPMAVGRSDGTITVWDLQPNPDTGGSRTLLCELPNVHSTAAGGGGVSKLTFLNQEPILVSIGQSSNSILMHIFDNPDHSARLWKSRKGHVSAPTKIQYLLQSSAGGGMLAQNKDGTDAAACQILSGGSSDRTLRMLSTARSVLDRELSQGKGLAKKAKKWSANQSKSMDVASLLLPPIIGIATSEARSRDWGNIVTIHQQHAFAYVWSSKRAAQSGPILRQTKWNVSTRKIPPPSTCHAASLTLSSCGNFCLVGTRGGIIYKYNIQSGLPRGQYPPPTNNDDSKEEGRRKQQQAGDISRTLKALEKSMKVSNRVSDQDKMEHNAVAEARREAKRNAKLKEASHDGYAVTGVAVDGINKTLISVGEDAKLILWNFGTHAPHKKSPYRLPAPATKLCHVRESDLAAIALRDYTVVLFDCTSLEIVRRFGQYPMQAPSTTSLSNVPKQHYHHQHTGPITDLGFSPDARSLYTSSMDGTLRVWDVPTNTCVDWLAFRTPPTSLTVSPTGEFLATTHVNKRGICLWSDKSFYQTVHVDGAHPPVEPHQMDEPAPLAEGTSKDHESTSDTESHHRANIPVPTEHTKTSEDAKQVEDEVEGPKGAVSAKEKGLITMSGLPPAHWKNLFRLELVKERNKPKEAPKKPPTAPFFLQWRGGSDDPNANPLGTQATEEKKQLDEKTEEDEWAAAWSDDDGDGDETGSMTTAMAVDGSEVARKKRYLESSASRSTGNVLDLSESRKSEQTTKRRKVSYHRSHLASLLQMAFEQEPMSFQDVTDYIATLGPSAIDVALSTLCNGMHDLEDGVPLLRIAALWLVEACESRERHEAVNSYLHRFLHVHANVLAGIEDGWTTTDKSNADEEDAGINGHLSSDRLELLDSLKKLRSAQAASSSKLEEKTQHSLCLLRHFCRMV